MTADMTELKSLLAVVAEGRTLNQDEASLAFDVMMSGNATPAQIALAWLIAQPLITAPIASATTVAQLQELMKAPAIKLSGDDLAALDLPA